MGAVKSKDTVDGKLSDTLELLESLIVGDDGSAVGHNHSDTVEEAVRRLKGKLPEKVRRASAD